MLSRMFMESDSIFAMYYSDACLVFMLTGIICAAVRWAHMCHPYDEDPQYFYPARKLVVFFYSAIIMQFPYYLNPFDDGVWAYIRMFGIIYYPVCFCMLFIRYFQWKQLDKWKNRLYVGIPMFMLAIMLLAVIWNRNGWFERQAWWMQYIAGGCSILLSIRLFMITQWMKDGIDKYHKDNFSTEDDFPYRFAEKVIGLPLIWIILMWGLFLSGSRDFKVVLDLGLSVWMVLFLCTILHPQRMISSKEVERKLKLAEEEERKIIAEEKQNLENEKKENESSDNPSLQYNKEVKDMVIAVIIRRFREPHLLKTEVLAEIERGMTAPASRFIASVGYYNLINMFRLRYAELYIEEHPNAKQAEIAEASGFLSDQALCRARKNITFIEQEFVKDVHL